MIRCPLSCLCGRASTVASTSCRIFASSSNYLSRSCPGLLVPYEDFGSTASESAIPATTYVHVRSKPPEVQVKGAAAAIFEAITMRDDSALEWPCKQSLHPIAHKSAVAVRRHSKSKCPSANRAHQNIEGCSCEPMRPSAESVRRRATDLGKGRRRR